MRQLYRMHKTKPVTFQRQVNELKHRTQKEVQAMVIAWISFRHLIHLFISILFIQREEYRRCSDLFYEFGSFNPILLYPKIPRRKTCARW